MSEQNAERPSIAESMAELAELFREGAAAGGVDFNYERADSILLETYFDAVLKHGADDDVLHSLIISGGAYLGELLVRLAGARWSEEDQSRPILVLANGLTGHPLDKVAKRVHLGSEHNLTQYAEFVLTGADPETFPGATVHETT